MKKLNIPFLLFLVIGFMVLVVGTHFLHGYQLARNAANLRERADRAGEKGDVDEQIRILQRYLRYEPDDMEQLKVLLGASRDRTLSAESVNLQEIYKQYNSLEKAIRNHPEDVELRRLGLDFALHPTVMRIPDAVSHLKSIESAGEMTNKDKVIFAQCLEAQSKTGEAIADLSAMVGYNASSNSFSDEQATAVDEVTAYMVLLSMLERQSSREIADEVSLAILNRMVEKNPESASGYLRRASFYQGKDEDPQAEEKSLADVQKALEVDSQSGDSSIGVVLNAVSIYLKLGRIQEANTLLQGSLDKYPDDRRIYMALSEVKLREGNNEAALAVVEQGLAKLPLNPELIYQRASIELDLGRVEDCRNDIKRLREERFDPSRLDMLLARVLIKEGNLRDAESLLLRLSSRGRHSDWMSRRIDSLLMSVYKGLGQHDKVAPIAERMGENSNNAKFELARSLFLQGRYDEAEEHLTEIVKNTEVLTPEGKVLIFRMTMDCRIAREQQKPEAARDWTSVDNMAKIWVERQGYTDAQQLQFQIDLLRRKGQLREARALAETAVQRHRNNANLWMLLNNLTTDNAQGMSILNQIQDLFGDSLPLRAARADRIVAMGGDDASAQLLGLLNGSEGYTPKNQALLKSVVVNQLARIRAYDDAIKLLQELSAQDPSNVTLKTTIFDLAIKSGNRDLIGQIMQELATDPGKNSTEWRIAEATRLLWENENGNADDGALTEAWDLVEKARDARPDWAPVYELQADILNKRSNFEAAASALETALEKRPGHSQSIKKLATVYKRLGRGAEASRLMSQLPDSEKSRDDLIDDLRRIAAADPQAALVRAKSLIPEDTTQVLDLVLLSDVQAVADQKAEALSTLKRAIQVDPNVPQGWTRMVALLLQEDRADDAKSVVAQLPSKVSSESLPLIQGQCQALLGDYGEAVKAYEAGIQADPENDVLLRNLVLAYQASGQNEKMVQSLDKIMASNGTSANWARRTKASMLAATSVYKDFLQSLELLEQNADESGNLTGEDLVLWLRFSAQRPEALSRERAATRLNEIRQQRRLSVPERAILASLHKQNGRWEDAKATMLDVMANAPNDTGYATTFVQWLLEEDELADATAWLRSVPKQSVDSLRFSTILLVRQGKAQDAAKALLDLSKQVRNPAQANNVSNVAIIMEEAGKYDPRFYELAEKQWKRYVQLRPNQGRRLVEFYSRVPGGKKLDEAIELCQTEIVKAIKANDPAMMRYYFTLALQGLRTNEGNIPPNSDVFARITKWFDAAKSRNLDDLELSWLEVDFYDIQGDTDKLDELYRAFLNRSDASDLQKAVVRNNLAYQLAASGRGAEALEVIGDAIDQLGPRADFLDTRALAYLASGDYANAVKDLNLALNSGNESGPMLFHLALAYDGNGDRQQAAQSLQRALDLGLQESDMSQSEAEKFTRLQEKLKDEMAQGEPQL